MSAIEDAVLAPFIAHLKKAAKFRGVKMHLLELAIDDARSAMREDESVRVMESALSGKTNPKPLYEVSEMVSVFAIACMAPLPAVGEKIALIEDGIIKLKNAHPNWPRGTILAIEPGGLTAQVILDRR